ncbi:uncharacterized protein MKK02DRAFT_26925 [Dioszegia hungarica]|uniref:NmrA-like domain-containing protein n=1 Tax=Dioszegia hungarica TaxID=4972 RepID=A0AA38H935_9TREE|nr:uncharacterized protein MKK02DRAFT_26925 [Dioszegia hungarica]KAI9636563.1 hypothetical protein MKK02DRAFT_26925 [Dioszegia hungarica]
MPTEILIVGATGKQGGKALSNLLESPNASSNLSLRFLTRNPTSASAQKLVARGAKAVKGDLNDTSSLNSALEGVDRAFFVTDALAGEAKEVQQGKNFVNAAQKAGVKHLVFTSVCAADTATIVPHFRSKYEVEKHLQASGISHTILRPVAFMDNFPVASGITRFLGIGAFFAFTKGRPCAFIAVEDIGVFAGKALLSPEDPAFKNQIIDLAEGDYDLESTRRSIQKAQGYSPWLASYIPGFTRSILPHDFKMMFTYFEQSGYPAVNTAELKKIHPGLMSMEDYFRKG